MAGRSLTVFLAGDVMTGRGIDQIMKYSCDPVLYEGWVKDAREYAQLAIDYNGPFPENREVDYIWGEALKQMSAYNVDVRIINLETAVTTHTVPWPYKGINYRMHPKNVPSITCAKIDVCVLGNNHIMDWCEEGLKETLTSLHDANIKTVGAGLNLNEATSPAIVDVAGKGRVILLSIAHESSGVMSDWLATENKAGVNFVDQLDSKCVANVKQSVQSVKKSGDIAILSIHWGGNWGYHVSSAFENFAKSLIDDAGIDIVYGHSSHHPKAIQVYHSKVIFYGCGDFLNDYEGIRSHLEYNADLTFMYLVKIDTKSHEIIDITLIPAKIKHFRIQTPSASEVSWLENMIKRECSKYNTTVVRENNHFTIKVQN